MLKPSFLFATLLLLPFLLFLPSTTFAWVSPSSMHNEFSDYNYWTGVTKYFVFNVTTGLMAPDGFVRNVTMINGYTPGPDLVVDEGDWVEIEVNNESVDEITIHWHGIEQRGTPWSDGVAGVTQFPIGVSSQFIYSFRATQHGFYWYHAHNRGLLGDGLRGTLYINPRPGREQPFHLIPNATVDQLVRAETESKKVLLADWSHRSSEEILTTWNATSISPLCIQSMLINGRGQQICASPATLAASGTNLTAQGCRNPTLNPANGTRPDLLDPETWFNCRNTSTPLENFVVDPASEWLALQLVNAGSEWSILFTIDEHQFWVFAADGSYIEPSLVSGITIAMGERYSIFVRLDKPSGTSYNIRIAALGQTISGYALLSYESGCNDSTRTSTSPLPTVTASSIPSISYGGAPLNATTFVRFNATYHPPYPANPPPLGPADVTLRLDYGPRGPTVWVLNNEPFSLWRELETPVLFDPTISLGANLSLPYRSGDVVDLILSASLGNPSHSIHKHGVKGWNIGFANTAFNYSSTTEAAAALPRAFNFVNPPFRDNMNTPAAFATPAWAAIRFFSDDPAPIFIHCHISLHLSAGMALVLLESIDNLPPIPTRYLEYAEEFSGQTFSSTPYVGFDSNYTSINFNASVPVNTTASFNTTS